MEDQTLTHPPEVVAEAMRQEMRDLEIRDPETAAALQQAAAQDRRENDPVDAAEQAIVDEAAATVGRPNQGGTALKTPRRATPPSRSQSRSPSQNPSRSRSQGPSHSTSAEASSADEGERPERTVRGSLEQVAAAGQKGARRRGTVTEADWAEFLGILFGFASLLFIWWLTSGLHVSKAERLDLELSDDEAEALARPAARILARSALNDRYGKNVIGMSDYILMAVVMVAYAERVTPVVKQKIQLARPGRARPEREVSRARSPIVEDPAPGEGAAQPQQWGVFAASAT